MKRFLLAALAAFLLCAPSYAANTATAQPGLPIRVGGAGPVVPYVVTFDTTGTDLTVVTPAAGKMACIVGIQSSDINAANVNLTSASTVNVTLKLPASSPYLNKPINGGAIFCTQPGEALKIQVSALISTMLLYVVQANYLDFSGR